MAERNLSIRLSVVDEIDRLRALLAGRVVGTGKQSNR
jgi:hypothetical protein